MFRKRRELHQVAQAREVEGVVHVEPVAGDVVDVDGGTLGDEAGEEVGEVGLASRVPSLSMASSMPRTSAAPSSLSLVRPMNSPWAASAPAVIAPDRLQGHALVIQIAAGEGLRAPYPIDRCGRAPRVAVAPAPRIDHGHDVARPPPSSPSSTMPAEEDVAVGDRGTARGGGCRRRRGRRPRRSRRSGRCRRPRCRPASIVSLR